MRPSEIIERYLLLIAQIRQKYLAELPVEKAEAFEKSLFDLRLGVRWYQIAAEEQIHTLWKQVREAEPESVLLDYVVMGTAELNLRAHDNDSEWRNVLEQLVQSLVWVTKDPYVDDAITERGPDGEWLKKTFEGSPWLVFLYLHRFVNQV